MGKKKVVKKTKELSVAIAESSAMSEVSQQQQQQSNTPRKRGRPRKITVKDEEDAVGEVKKLITSEGEGSENREEAKDESKGGGEEFEEKQIFQPQRQQPTRRARRKSKPRKSW